MTWEDRDVDRGRDKTDSAKDRDVVKNSKSKRDEEQAPIETILGTEDQSTSPQPDPEILVSIINLRSQVRESFGKVVMAMMMLPRYRHQTLADLMHLALDPLIRDRVAIAQHSGKPALTEDVAGIAIWASLSDEAEARLLDQIKGGVWPIRLRSEDWNSGKNNWLIDVIAPDKRAMANVIANFKQVVTEDKLKLHPHVTRMLDRKTLEAMGARRDGAAPAAPAEAGATIN